jgi:SAM-dependent methyltransferase
MRYQPARELLDEDLGTPEEVAESLNDLWWLNSRFGGVHTHQKLFSRLLDRRWSPEYSILDVGTGTGQMATATRDWLMERHIACRMFILDRRHSHLHHGDPIGFGLTPVVADVLVPPFADGSFDVVTCSLFLHHFSGDRAVQLLQRMHALARVAVLISDLERAWLPYMFIRVISHWAKSRLTRHDAPISFRQAYTAGELDRLARECGFANFQVVRLKPYWLGLLIWKDAHE